MRDKGIFMILLGIMLGVIVLFVILVIGMGYLGTGKTRFQQTANLASLAALDAFLSVTPNPATPSVPPTYKEMRAAAKTRAEEILRINRLPGTKAGNTGDLDFYPTFGDEGSIQLGEWVRPDPTSTPDKPYFIDRTALDSDGASATGIVNAIRILAHTPDTNDIFIPLAGFAGKKKFKIHTSSTATIVQRCLAFIMDLSSSATAETHDIFNPMTWMPNAGYFAYEDDGSGGVTGKQDAIDAWNSTPPKRNGSTDQTMHFQDDYFSVSTIRGNNFRVDRYIDTTLTPPHWGPEPLSRFFLAFNAGIKVLEERGTNADRALFVGVRSDKNANYRDDVDMFPTVSAPTKLTDQFGLLLQLTNVLHRGKDNDSPGGGTSPRYPNFIDRGWFPMSGVGFTPMAEGMYRAVNALKTCPPSSQRALIVATDGIANCTRSPLKCNNSISGYINAQNEILQTLIPEFRKYSITVTVMMDGKAVGPNIINRKDPDGNYLPVSLGPKYYYGNFDIDYSTLPPTVTANDPTKHLFNTTNRVPSAANGGGDACSGVWKRADGSTCQDNWLKEWCEDPSIIGSTDAPYNIYSGPYLDSDYSVPACAVNWPAGWDPDKFALEFKGRTLYFKDGEVVMPLFRESIGLWGQVAIETGGVFCPLLPKCPSNVPACVAIGEPTYQATGPQKGELNDCARTDGAGTDNSVRTQTCALRDLSKAEQAERCVMETLGANPFVLVEKED